jgi:hypothetical protein
MKKLLSLAVLAMSPFAFTQTDYSCVNSNHKATVGVTKKNIVLTLDNQKAITLQIDKVTTKNRTYKNGSNKVKISFNRGIKKLTYKTGFLSKITFKNCIKKRAEVPRVEPTTPIRPEFTEPDKLEDVTVVNPSKGKIFNKYGKLTKIKYKPVSSPSSFEYDVIYYIPEKLKGKKDLKTLVFLHGGGASTSTRAGSLSVIDMYAGDLVSIAEQLGVVLVLPSGSGINWGGHLLNYMRDLNQTLRNDLYLDPNGIALSGHSMGGMGITRSGYWLTDDYAFFLPIAAGMVEKNQTEKNLLTFFNMKYHHMQGLSDHFGVFISRCRNQVKNIKALEQKYNKKTGFVMDFYNGSHNYPKKHLQNTLSKLFKESSRDLYQKELYGNLYHRKEVLTDRWSNGNEYYLAPRDRYFWLKATNFSLEKTVIAISAKVEENTINIKVEEGVKTLRVYLSNKMMDLSKEVSININGSNRFRNIPSLDQDMSAEVKRDAGYIFDGYIDIEL